VFDVGASLTLSFPATPQKEIYNLLTDTRIAGGVFFQLLDSAVLSLWALL